jgi:hypothetical protein
MKKNPILRALELKNYHPDYAGKVIWVCVNQPYIVKEIYELLRGYRLLTEETPEPDDRKAEELVALFEQNVDPKINECFARLWSYGPDSFTAKNLAEYQATDPHLITWLKTRSLEIVEAQMELIAREQKIQRKRGNNSRLH